MINVKIRESKSKPKNPLAGAINVAIEKAERYGTPLIIKRNGKIEEISPSQMRRAIKDKN